MEPLLGWVLNSGEGQPGPHSPLRSDSLAVARLGTGRAVVAYVLLAGLQRGISLIILPFISHAMSPVEFGAASTLTAAGMLLTAIVAAPLIQLVIRAAARGEEDGPALLKISGLYCYGVMPVLFGIAAIPVAALDLEMLGVPGYIWAIELIAVGFQPAASVFGLWVSQAKEDLRTFFWLSSTTVLVTAGSKLALVVYMEMGVLGWALSDLLSAMVSAFVAMLMVRLPRARVNSKSVRFVLGFSVPLIPHSASMWALSSLSRPAMAAVSSLAQVGLLSFGLSLASIAGIVLAEINRAVLSRYSRESFKAPTEETFAPVVWQSVAAFVVPAITAVALAVAGEWAFASAYWSAFSLTAVLLVGQAAYGLYLIPMNYLTQTAGKPKFSSLATGAGALVIFVSILLFGRTYGAAGVAYATSVGYVTMAAVALGVVRGLKLDIEWRQWMRSLLTVLLAAVGLAFSVAAVMVSTGSVWRWSLCAGALIISAAAVLLAKRDNARQRGQHGSMGRNG